MSAEDPRDAGLKAYADFFAGLTPERIGELRRLCTADVRFRDPFNDVRGIDDVIRVFEKMYEDADQISFEIVDRMRHDDRGMLLWTFRCRPKSLGGREPWLIEGASEIHLAADGRIKAHLDHWDSGTQFYARLPIVGALIRLLRRRLQI